MTKLPEEFLQRLQHIVPETAWVSTIQSFESIKPLIIRTNPLQTTTEEVTARLNDLGIPHKAISWKPDAFCIPIQSRELTLKSDLYQQGLIYSQNLSSQLAPMVLAPQPGEEILDMCASPGGKTLQIAGMLQQTGRIAAVEKIKSRFFKLKANLKSQHVDFVHTYLADAIPLWRKTPERFDRVLLDAPCSTESRFHCSNPDSFSHWNRQKIKETARKQKKLLFSAIHCLKPGGTLVYCTCAFAPEENEAVIDYACHKFAESIAITPIDLPFNNLQPGLTHWQGKAFNPAVKQSVRVLPNNKIDGFFLCKIIKTQSTLN
ncbi:MAG: RsmB/NOP family class I SAM-dependent RNA methyltransferase [Gammaproteobacteria bacterium]|nr:RsmB/NOP family class I SAM-dependent RNA methyltransferase [Gammaproteobacteria bacterium]